MSVLSGCSRGQAPQPEAVDQVSATVEGAFKEANPEAKTSAQEVVNALQSNDDPKAFLELQQLSSRADLTPEQRDAAARSMKSLNEKLRSAAAQGDQRAGEALQIYRARK